MERNVSLKESKLPLTGFDLKIIGIILMLFDHIHQMFVHVGAPMWFTMLGRLVAPIFIFLSTEGLRYTHSRLKYVRNLLFGSIAMNLMSVVLQKVLPNPNIVLMNNIFGTLLILAILISAIDLVIDGVKKSNYKNAVIGVLILLAYAAYNVFAMSLISIPFGINLVLIFPPVYLVEGGFVFIILGLLFYYLRKRPLQIAALAVIAIISTKFWTEGFTMGSLFTSNIQWMMVFSGILMALYNGREGRKMKKFFYIFYPAHIAVLYIISTLLFIV
ncbi:TraX family protein [Anaerosphaera multitolerans]|nr:TraX family protein [Anaerosphaera multitolerans]